MTFNCIITELYLSKELDDCISKMVKTNRDDFKQELFLILSQLPHDKVQHLYTNEKIKFYVVRVIINLSRSKEHSYQKTYNDQRVTYDTDRVGMSPQMETSEIEARMVREAREMMLCSEVDKLEDQFGTPYYKGLIDLIVLHGSMRAVSRLTGIPISSVHRGVKRVREHLQSI